MSEELEELFGDAGGQPVPRSRLVGTLLGSGLLLATLGMACSAAPGGLMVLAAWMVVEKEMDRVESGYLPADSHSEVRRLQQMTLVALAIVVVLFFVQTILFSLGVYEGLWTRLVELLVSWLGDGALPG